MRFGKAMRLSALAILVAGAAQAQTPATPLDEVRKLVFEQINRDRAEAGVRPVAYAPELSRAADAHAEEMLRDNYTSHWNRAGWKPYLGYAHAGIRDYTAENVASYWCTGCAFNLQKLRAEVLLSHRNFMDEKPPLDGHRKSILDPTHTQAGIGLAYGENGFRMIELFAGRYAELEPLPLRAALDANFRVSGRVTAPGHSLLGISIFYEPLPRAMSLQQLKETYSYSLPDEERMERPSLSGTPRRYLDGTLGTVEMGAGGAFQAPLRFWKQQPGVYTVAVWVRREREPAFVGAMTSVIVEK